MDLSAHLKDALKVIGYFSCSIDGGIFSHGNTCIIAGSEELMKSYLEKNLAITQTEIEQNFFIRKMRLGKFLENLIEGEEYGFDEESYDKFISFIKKTGIESLLENAENIKNNTFSESPPEGSMKLVRIKLGGSRGKIKR